ATVETEPARPLGYVGECAIGAAGTVDRYFNDPRHAGFEPSTGARLYDSRTEGRLAAGRCVRLHADSSGATAVALHIAAVASAGQGWVMATPCNADGSQARATDVSQLSFDANTTIADVTAVTMLSPDGDI